MTPEQKKEFLMFVPDDDGSAMDWVENQLEAERERIIRIARELPSLDGEMISLDDLIEKT
jgi:hypothetical protein